MFVSFDVDEKCKPENLHADQASDAERQGEVLDAVTGWRFEPGVKDGRRGGAVYGEDCDWAVGKWGTRLLSSSLESS